MDKLTKRLLDARSSLEGKVSELQAENSKLRAEVESLKDDKDLLTGQLQQSRKHVKEVDLEINAMKPVVEAAEKYFELPPPHDEGTWEALQKAVEKYQGKSKKRNHQVCSLCLKPAPEGPHAECQKRWDAAAPNKRKCECIPGVHKNCPEHGYPPLRPLEGPGSVDE